MQLEPVSVGLKFAFLAILYLFLLWVARSALHDLRDRGSSRPGAEHSGETPAGQATSLHAVGEGAGSRQPRLVVQSVPGHQSGSAYGLQAGATLGRGDVEIPLEDPFASTRHARLEPQGGVVVLEDLGSTNGTYLNEQLLDGPRPLHPGDCIRIGDSTFSFEHD